MSGMQPVPDPYRVLGVVRGATLAQIKAAHRTLAKRHHPDGEEGDTARFLAVQDAYLLLSDPIRRRQWDARHEPGPVRAGEGTVRGRRDAASGRWTRENPEAGVRHGPRSGPRRASGPESRRPEGATDPTQRPSRPPAPGFGHAASEPARDGEPSRDGEAARDGEAPAGSPPADDDRRRDPSEWSASGRDPRRRHYTWSAEGVPWWQDFPGPRGAGPDADASTPAPPAPSAATSAPPPDGFDVYNRSSGAAWSSAARRFFRQADGDLPSRGSFRRQGTQYVTGARARQVADAEARQATGRAASSSTTPASTATESARHDRVTRPEPAPTTTVLGTTHTTVDRGTDRTVLPPDLGQRLAEAALAWVALVAVIGWGLPTAAACQPTHGDCAPVVVGAQALLAVVALALFVAFPRLARIGAIATVAALGVAVPLVIIAVTLSLLPPAPPIEAAGVVAIAGAYVIAAVVAGLATRPKRPT